MCVFYESMYYPEGKAAVSGYTLIHKMVALELKE